MLAVIQHDQRGPVPQVANQAVQHRPGRPLCTDRLSDHLRYGCRIHHTGQPNQPHPVREPIAGVGGHLESEAGLPSAARSGQADQPMLTEQRRELRPLPFPAHERGHPHRQVGQGRRHLPGGGTQPRVLSQDRLLEVAQLLRRVQAQLVIQGALQPAEGGERISLTAGPIQREHELSVQPLPERVRGGQGL